MGSTAKGLALIPQLVLQSSSTSTAVAAATAAVLGQGISQGWSRWAGQVHAREWLEKPYFAQERPSGTRLMTAPDPPNGIMYVKVGWKCKVLGSVVLLRKQKLGYIPGIPTCTSQPTDSTATKDFDILIGEEVSKSV